MISSHSNHKQYFYRWTVVLCYSTTRGVVAPLSDHCSVPSARHRIRFRLSQLLLRFNRLFFVERTRLRWSFRSERQRLSAERAFHSGPRVHPSSPPLTLLSLALSLSASFRRGDGSARADTVRHVFAGDEHPPGILAPSLPSPPVRNGAAPNPGVNYCIRIWRNCMNHACNFDNSAKIIWSSWSASDSKLGYMCRYAVCL
jgi:hypothetical protein